MLGLLEAPDSLVQLFGVLVRRQELLPGFRANLPERRFGAIELADEVVDPGLAADVLRAELGQAALAVLDVGLLGLRLRDALTELSFAVLELAVDGVQFGAALVEDVDGAAQDVALDAAAEAVAEAGVRGGHCGPVTIGNCRPRLKATPRPAAGVSRRDALASPSRPRAPA